MTWKQQVIHLIKKYSPDQPGPGPSPGSTFTTITISDPESTPTMWIYPGGDNEMMFLLDDMDDGRFNFGHVIIADTELILKSDNGDPKTPYLTFRAYNPSTGEYEEEWARGGFVNNEMWVEAGKWMFDHIKWSEANGSNDEPEHKCELSKYFFCSNKVATQHTGAAVHIDPEGVQIHDFKTLDLMDDNGTIHPGLRWVERDTEEGTKVDAYDFSVIPTWNNEIIATRKWVEEHGVAGSYLELNHALLQTVVGQTSFTLAEDQEPRLEITANGTLIRGLTKIYGTKNATPECIGEYVPGTGSTIPSAVSRFKFNVDLVANDNTSFVTTSGLPFIAVIQDPGVRAQHIGGNQLMIQANDLIITSTNIALGTSESDTYFYKLPQLWLSEDNHPNLATEKYVADYVTSHPTAGALSLTHTTAEKVDGPTSINGITFKDHTVHGSVIFNSLPTITALTAPLEYGDNSFLHTYHNIVNETRQGYYALSASTKIARTGYTNMMHHGGITIEYANGESILGIKSEETNVNTSTIGYMTSLEFIVSITNPNAIGRAYWTVNDRTGLHGGILYSSSTAYIGNPDLEDDLYDLNIEVATPVRTVYRRKIFKENGVAYYTEGTWLQFDDFTETAIHVNRQELQGVNIKLSKLDEFQKSRRTLNKTEAKRLKEYLNNLTRMREKGA